MRQSLKHLYGHPLAARDGEIGRVKDFYFDELNWAVRYFLMNTGTWTLAELIIRTGHRLSGQEVLVPVTAVKQISYNDSSLFLGLTKAELEGSPHCTLDDQGAVR